MGTRVRWILLFCLLGASIANAQNTPPVIFFSDLTYAPNSGGESVSGFSGAYVTIYGNFFGASQGSSTITWNNSNCLRVVSWGSPWLWYQKIVVQLGSQCVAGAGNFVVNVGGQTSNGVLFTVGAGHIYFISTSGSDSNSGSFASPWRTIPHAVQIAGKTPGNIIYAMNGVQATVDDGQGWAAALLIRNEWSQGTAAQPDALIAYPGATVQIGPSTATSPNFGLRTTDYSASPGPSRGYWTFGGLSFRGVIAALICGGTLNNASQYWRFVANDISNAQSTGSGGGGAAMEFILSINSKVLGNYLHDLNQATTDRLWQGLYLSTDANYIEVGWNELYNSKGRSGVQTHSSNLCVPSCTTDQTGYLLHDLSIHDNKIHHTQEEGLLLDTVDPSIGSGIKVFNNVIYDCALDGQGDCAHFQLSGDFNHGNGYGSSPAPAWWYNNTVYATTTTGTYVGVYGTWWPDIHSSGQTLTSRVANNVLYSAGTAPYLDMQNWSGSACTDSPSGCGTNSGNRNLMYGKGAATFPGIFPNTVNQNPMFVNGSAFDFHLQSSSPALGKGLQTITDYTGNFSVVAPVYDIDGRIRPNPPSIGAYEFASGSIAVVSAPANLVATVQ